MSCQGAGLVQRILSLPWRFDLRQLRRCDFDDGLARWLAHEARQVLHPRQLDCLVRGRAYDARQGHLGGERLLESDGRVEGPTGDIKSRLGLRVGRHGDPCRGRIALKRRWHGDPELRGWRQARLVAVNWNLSVRGLNRSEGGVLVWGHAYARRHLDCVWGAAGVAGKSTPNLKQTPRETNRARGSARARASAAREAGRRRHGANGSPGSE